MKCNPWVGGSIGRRGFPMLGTGKRGLSTYIKELFKNGEQGFFYDPSDLNTQYQNAAGTTAVNATGQPVGLMLDKSKGLVRGNEILRNGDFRNGLDGWGFPSNTATHFATLDGGNLRYYSETASPVFNVSNTLISPLKIGALYEITVVVTKHVVGAIKSDSFRQANLELAKGVGTFVCYGVASLSGFTFLRNSPAVDMTISSISIKEVLGNHTYQTTSAARPILKHVPILGIELLPTYDFRTWVTVSSPNPLTSNSFTTTGAGGVRADILKPNTKYLIELDFENTATINVYYGGGGNTAFVAGARRKLRIEVTSDNGSTFYIRNNVAGVTTVYSIKIQEITGYRTDQKYIEYDGVDDKLITNLPSELANCTVLRAIPNVGTQVKYNQTLPMLHEDSTNHSGLIAIDRALTRKEQLRLVTEFDKRAGVEGFDKTTSKMFDNATQGFWYDPNDLSTMYQNSTGTIPVTDVGQPVGLILDKSKQLQRGVNLTDDFDFRTWSVLSGAITEKSSFTIAGHGGITRNVGMVVGKWYKIDIEYTTTNPTRAVDLLNGNHGGSPFLQSTSSGKISCYCLAANALLYIRTNTATLTVTKFVVQEVLGNHARQTTSASRPILGQNATTGAYYLEFDGVDDLLQTSNIDLSTSYQLTLFAGVKYASDTSVKTQMIAEFSESSISNVGSFALWRGYSSKPDYAFRLRDSTYRDLVVTLPTHSNVLTAYADASKKIQVLNANGVFKGSGGATVIPQNFGDYPLFIGGNTAKSFSFAGHIYGLMGIGRLTADIETRIIENELANRTGVTLNV